MKILLYPVGIFACLVFFGILSSGVIFFYEYNTAEIFSKEDFVKAENQDSFEVLEKDGIIPLVDKVDGEKIVHFVKHSSRDGYSIAIENEEGGMIWRDLDRSEMDLKISVDSNASESKLIRNKNILYTKKFKNRTKIQQIQYSYTLVIKKNGLEGDEYERNCGKKCVENITETILD